MVSCWAKALVLACAVAAAAMLPRQAYAAGAAYAVDTAEVSEAGNCKIESWMSGAANHDFFAATTPTCVLGFAQPVEASTQFARSRASEEWTTTATPKFKTNLTPSAIGVWGVALSGAASYDLITHRNTALFATIPATLRLSNVVRINLNGGWQWDRIADKHYFTYGAGTDWRTPDNVWTLTAEIFGQLGSAQDVNSLIQPRFQLGLRGRPVDDFNMDLIYGRNIAGENSNWLTLATVVRFPAGK